MEYLTCIYTTKWGVFMYEITFWVHIFRFLGFFFFCLKSNKYYKNSLNIIKNMLECGRTPENSLLWCLLLQTSFGFLNWNIPCASWNRDDIGSLQFCCHCFCSQTSHVFCVIASRNIRYVICYYCLTSSYLSIMH